MKRFLFAGTNAAMAAIVLIPLLFFLNKNIRNKQRTVWYCLMAIYLSGVYALAGLPTVGYIRFDPNINLVPFAYLFSDFTNSFLNVLLFVPLGILLPLLWKRFKNPLRTVFFGLLVSAAIEFLQLFTLRATDINDLMTNTSGALMGWIIGRIAVCFYSVPGSSERKRDVYQVIGIAFSVMFFLQPVIENLVWRIFA